MIGRITREWPLAIILAAQAVLTLPWLWRTAPFTDEGLCLDAGHQVWSRLLHHTPLPDYASWFSGAPVLYPPLGALADSAGGLPTARGLSLVFMAAATALVYYTGARLFGKVAAFLGAALFAVTGLVVHYGALATYNAPALCCLAAGMWAASHLRDGSYGWLTSCALALAAANAFKYATLAWDPVVAGLVVLHGWDRGRVSAVTRAVSLALTVGIVDGGLLLAAGPGYVRGVVVTTLFRTIHWGPPSPAAAVLWRAFTLTGILLALAAAGVALSLRRERPTVTLLLTLLLAAGLAAPVDQARIHQLGSLDKNLGFGLIFTVLAAGYALNAAMERAVARYRSGQVAAGAAAIALVMLVLVTGRQQSVQFRGTSLLTASEVVSAIQRNYASGTFILTPGAGRAERYYFPQIPSPRWLSVLAPDAAAQVRIWQRICAGQVSLLLLRQVGGKYDRPFDSQLRPLLAAGGAYRAVERTGRGNYAMQVWQLAPTRGSVICS